MIKEEIQKLGLDQLIELRMAIGKRIQEIGRERFSNDVDAFNDKTKKGGHYSQIRVGDKIRIEHKKTVGKEFTVTKVNNKTFKCIDKDGWEIFTEKPLAYAI
jgi:hypothetical protein